jgi:branched-subunit amino acid ABC-type transport system permease component
MNAHHIPQSSVGRRPFLRPLAILGATVVTLFATAGPALAVHPPEPRGDGAVTETTSVPVSLPAASDSLSTAQVVTISLLVSLAVAMIVVGLVYVLRRRSRTADHTVTIPARRSREAASADQKAMAFDTH